jgi:hypothetical protein
LKAAHAGVVMAGASATAYNNKQQQQQLLQSQQQLLQSRQQHIIPGNRTDTVDSGHPFGAMTRNGTQAWLRIRRTVEEI